MNDPFVSLGLTIGSAFAVVVALLTGMQRVRKVVAADVLEELKKCEEDRSKDAAKILDLSTRLATATERISNLEQVMIKYLRPIGGRDRESDHNKDVIAVLSGIPRTDK